MKVFVAVISFPIEEQVCLGKYKIVDTDSQLVLHTPAKGEGTSRVEQDEKGKEMSVSRHSFLICSKGQTGAKHWQLHSGNFSIEMEDCLLGYKWNIAGGSALPVEQWSVGSDRTFNALFTTVPGQACTKRVPMLRFVLLNSLCPRQHTTAFVPSSGRIYSFGLGGNGQLGTGTTSNRKSPFTVKGNWIPYSTQCPMSTGKQRLVYLLPGCLFLYSSLEFLRLN